MIPLRDRVPKRPTSPPRDENKAPEEAAKRAAPDDAIVVLAELELTD